MTAQLTPGATRYATFSRGMLRLRHLPCLLDAPLVHASALDAGELPLAVLGWGLKANTRAPRSWARRKGIPFWTLEDGLIRSVGLGVDGAEPFGFTVDRMGSVFYDARAPSDLEVLLSSGLVLPAGALEALAIWRQAGVSKYNHSLTEADVGPRTGRRRVLIVDQTVGDASIAGSLSSASTFADMLASAAVDHPDAELLVRIHPDVSRGRRRGFLTRAQGRNVRLVTGDIDPQSLLAQVDLVYTVSSQLGFEALCRGLPVTCFGVPFYAGWGATQDRVRVPDRRSLKLSVEQLFWAAYGLHSRYVDPVLGTPCDLSAILRRIQFHRGICSQHRGAWTVAGCLWPWKRGASSARSWPVRTASAFAEAQARPCQASPRRAAPPGPARWIARPSPAPASRMDSCGPVALART